LNEDQESNTAVLYFCIHGQESEDSVSSSNCFYIHQGQLAQKAT